MRLLFELLCERNFVQQHPRIPVALVEPVLELLDAVHRCLLLGVAYQHEEHRVRSFCAIDPGLVRRYVHYRRRLMRRPVEVVRDVGGGGDLRIFRVRVPKQGVQGDLRSD